MKSIVVGLVLFIGLSCPSGALLLPVGDPFEGGSWGQGFRESGVGDFDFVRVDWVSGSKFALPVHANLPSGWTTTNWWSWEFAEGAYGPARDDMTWNLKFQDPKSAPTKFVFTAWYGQTLKEEATASWSGSGWSISASSTWPTGANPRTPPVPEPGTAILAALAVGTMVLVRRIRR